ncbi:MAG: peptidase S9 prolyl oligopeptidase active site domain-containing [Chitinophagaceae bacterium]|nr:MAG: peptidase S9 prolyl oligopeptidase active site domain-containing [Chitinophagaceae bacterium]
MKKYLVLLLLPIIGFSQQKGELIKISDMLKIKQMSGINISPDGSKAVFVLNSIDQDGDSKWEYKYNNQLYIVPTDGSAAPKPLTAKDPAAQPVWSPDGKQLAFVRAVEGKPQIFLLSFEGGEPIQLTKFKYGASSPKFSPNGKQILFSASVSLKDLLKDSVLNPTKALPQWPMEKPGFYNNEFLKSNMAKADPDGSIDEIRAYLELNVNDRKAKVINKLNFQEEATTSGDLSFAHIFIVATEVGATPKARIFC